MRALASVAGAIALAIAGGSSTVPTGHMKPLGAHRPPEPGPDVEVGFPPAEDFFRRYVLPSKPVIMRGASDAWPARAKWDDDYFRKVMGSRKIEVEFSKKEDRSGDGAKVTVSEFLDEYDMDGFAAGPVTDLDGVFAPEGEDFAQEVGRRSNEGAARRGGRFAGKGGIYLVNEPPPVLLRDAWLPRGYFAFMRRKVRAPVMWMSSGGTSSVLHNDGDDNINCVVAGRKVIVLMNASYDADVYNGPQWSGYGHRSPVDTSAVDLVKWPRIARVPWYHVELLPGDCVFMPMGWLHAVRTPPGRSIAMNLWFQPALNPDWAAAEALDVAGAGTGSPAEWEAQPGNDTAAPGVDESWQPERLAEREDEAASAVGRVHAPLPQAAARIPLSHPAWPYTQAAGAGPEEDAEPLGEEEEEEEELESLVDYVHRDGMWLDRWLEGAATSLVPPWDDKPVPVPEWMEEEVQKRLANPPAAEDDEGEEDYGAAYGEGDDA